MVQIVVLEPDLLFSSKVESACAKLRVETKIVAGFKDLEASLRVEPPNVLIVNLDCFAGDLGGLKRLIQTPLKIVGYYSHVNSKLADEARAIGVDLIVPRGAFLNKIQDVLSELV